MTFWTYALSGGAMVLVFAVFAFFQWHSARWTRKQVAHAAQKQREAKAQAEARARKLREFEEEVLQRLQQEKITQSAIAKAWKGRNLAEEIKNRG